LHAYSLTTSTLPVPPPQATLHIYTVFLPAAGGILHGDETPPDAARGLEVPPARLSLSLGGAPMGSVSISNDTSSSHSSFFPPTLSSHQISYVSWWVEGGVVIAPLPDAAMPYNVIVLTSTACAFGVGMLINALARKGGERGARD